MTAFSDVIALLEMIGESLIRVFQLRGIVLFDDLRYSEMVMPSSRGTDGLIERLSAISRV